MSEPIHPIVVGTAGHVDHGKSSLVRALTGIDPDRLKEEKARGLTIDIGFANFLHRGAWRVGLVDVPGHERFIKNMVTGATGVDLVVLVVAANDGVMQQTREHIEILTLLGIKHGLIAITKVDLVEPDLIELVGEDIAEAVKGTFLEAKPMCPLSTITGQGMDAFRATLADAIDAVPRHTDRGAYRLPIQRVFSAKGHGAVLTGIAVRGGVAIGDEVETLPTGQRGRIRAIQAYHAERERAQAGHSAALNIAGIDHNLVHRGHIVCTPGYGRQVSQLIARVRAVASLSDPVKTGSALKLLIDNSEVMADFHLLGHSSSALAAGESAICKLVLAEPIVPAVGDRIILRLPSPGATVAGGVVVSLSDEDIRNKHVDRIAFFSRKADVLGDERKLVEHTVLEHGQQAVGDELVARECWLKPAEAAEHLEALVAAAKLRRLGPGRLMHAEAWKELEKETLRVLEAFHQENPTAPGIGEAALQQKVGIELRLLGEVAAELVEKKKVQRIGDVLVHSKYAANLSAGQESALERIRDAVQRAGFSAPSMDELRTASAANQGDFKVALDHFIKRGEGQVVGGMFVFSRASIEDAVERSRRFIEANGPMKAADFKTILDTTRKYAIPLLEHLDGKGYFYNRDGVRTMKR